MEFKTISKQPETPTLTTVASNSVTEKEPAKAETNDRGVLFIAFLNYLLQGMGCRFFDQALELILIEAGFDPSSLSLLSLQIYPFTFKVIFAPFLDAYHFRFLGRRKTYIVSFLLMFGLLQIVMGTQLQNLIYNRQLTTILAGGFVTMFLLSIHGLGVDTWMISSVHPSNYPVASGIKHIGNLCGQFMSVHFLILVGRLEIGGQRLLHPDSFQVFIGGLAIVVSMMVLMFKAEPHFNSEKADNPCFVLSHLKNFFTKSHFMLLTAFLLLHYVGFGAAEIGQNYFLVGQKGMLKEDLLAIDVFFFPLKLIAALYIGNLLKKKSVMGTMLVSYGLRFGHNICTVLAIRSFVKEEPHLTYAYLAAAGIFFVGCDTAFSVSLMAFYNKILDPLLGATHLSALFSLSNVGKYVAKTGILALFVPFDLETVCFGGWIFGAVFLVVFTRILFYLDSLPRDEWRLTNPKEDKLLEVEQV